MSLCRRPEPAIRHRLANLKKLCETHLAGKYRIEVIDLLQNPQLSRDDQIVAIPTLVRKLPRREEDHRRSVQYRDDAGRIAVGAPPQQRTRGEHEEPTAKSTQVRRRGRSAEISAAPVYQRRDTALDTGDRQHQGDRRKTRLPGRYELEVIDAYQQAERTRDQQIVVLPTLIKFLPRPLRRLVGDLSDEEHVLVGLGLGLEVNPDDDINNV